MTIGLTAALSALATRALVSAGSWTRRGGRAVRVARTTCQDRRAPRRQRPAHRVDRARGLNGRDVQRPLGGSPYSGLQPLGARSRRSRSDVRCPISGGRRACLAARTRGAARSTLRLLTGSARALAAATATWRPGPL